MAEAAENVLDGVLHRRRVGDVAGECVRVAAGRADLGDQPVEGFGVARQREYRRTAGGHRDRRGAPDAAGGSGDDHVLAHQRPAGIVPSRPVGVEVLGPVAPQLRRIRRELRNRDSGALQRFFGALAGERRCQVDDIENLTGNAELGGGHVAQDPCAPGRLQERGRRGARQRSDQGR